MDCDIMKRHLIVDGASNMVNPEGHTFKITCLLLFKNKIQLTLYNTF